MRLQKQCSEGKEFAGLDVLFSYPFQLVLQIDGIDINIRLFC